MAAKKKQAPPAPKARKAKKPPTPELQKAEKTLQTPSSSPAKPKTAPKPAWNPPTTPEGRMVWALNGAGWEAQSLKVAGRTYRCPHVRDHGWLAGYPGQKKTCSAAARYFPLAASARAACQAVEDSIA